MTLRRRGVLGECAARRHQLRATAAAGDRDVQVVGGVSVVRQLLAAGLADELHVDVMPLLLGDGLRFLDSADLDRVRLEKLGVQEVGARTSLRFRVDSLASVASGPS